MPQGTQEDPLFFQIIRTDDGDINWKRIGIALAVTVVTGYLASQSQRWGQNPDLVKSIKMRYHETVRAIADSQIRLWSKVSMKAETAYDIARI